MSPGCLESLHTSTPWPISIGGMDFQMEHYSFVLTGTERAVPETFGSAFHGAGRLMSRIQAIKTARGRSLTRELTDRGIIARASSHETMAEELPEAYKDVAQVVDAIVGAELARKIAKLHPVGIIKG